jgi:hypothetical protein
MSEFSMKKIQNICHDQEVKKKRSEKIWRSVFTFYFSKEVTTFSRIFYFLNVNNQKPTFYSWRILMPLPHLIPLLISWHSHSYDLDFVNKEADLQVNSPPEGRKSWKLFFFGGTGVWTCYTGTLTLEALWQPRTGNFWLQIQVIFTKSWWRS